MSDNSKIEWTDATLSDAPARLQAVLNLAAYWESEFGPGSPAAKRNGPQVVSIALAVQEIRRVAGGQSTSGDHAPRAITGAEGNPGDE